MQLSNGKQDQENYYNKSNMLMDITSEDNTQKPDWLQCQNSGLGLKLLVLPQTQDSGVTVKIHRQVIVQFGDV